MFARLAVALLALSAARAQTQCGNALSGRQTVSAVQLQTMTMSTGVLEYKVDVTANNLVTACGRYREVGLGVVACDYDLAPSVHVDQGLTEAHVRRTGDLSRGGYIYTTVYCDGPARVGKAVEGSVVRVEPGPNNAVVAPRSGVVGMPVFK